MRIDVDCHVGELVFQHSVSRSDGDCDGAVSFTGKSSVLQKSKRSHMGVKLHEEDGRPRSSVGGSVRGAPLSPLVDDLGRLAIQLQDCLGLLISRTERVDRSRGKLQYECIPEVRINA